MVKIIIVDDHPLFRKGIKATFNEINSDIAIIGEADCGEALFRILDSSTPDLILLDIILPDMSGVKIARRLKKEYPAVKILAISAENSAETVKAMIDAGIHGFINKRKGGTHELAEAIHAVMNDLEYFDRDISAIIYDIFVAKKKTTTVTNEFTEREKEIILACRDGLLSKEIADRLEISINTVNTHKKNIFQKLGINNTMEMVQYALKNGIIRLCMLTIMLLFLSCHSNHNNDDNQNATFTTSDLPSDSVRYATLDSLLQVVNTAPQDTTLAMLYYQIAEKYEDYDFVKASEYFMKMGSLCEQLKWNEGIYMSSIGLAHILIRQGEMDTAIVINLQAMELAKKEKNKLWIGKLAVNLGNAYLTKQWYDMALTCYMEALPLFEKMNDSEKLAVVYYQLSCLYSDINAVKKAIEFGEKALELSPDDPYSLLGLAKVYSFDQQYQKSNKCLTEALKFCKQQNNLYLMGVIYYHFSENALIVFDLANAEKYAILALEINGEIGNPAAYGGALSVLSKVEELKGNFAQSEIYINEVLKIVDELDNLHGKSFCYMILSELSIAQQKYTDNIEYWKAWELVNNQIAAETTLRTAGEMEAKYENEKKELEIEKQQLTISRKNIVRNLLIGGIAVCVTILALLFFMFRLRTRRNHALAEMNATKDKFFSIISHDMKSPAIVQRDAIQLLVNGLNQMDKETLRGYLTELLESAEGELELLYNLFNWAQMQTGRMAFTPTTFDLAYCIRSEIKLIQEMAKNKNITFLSQIPENILVVADRNMIATIVRNLLTNAVKFTAAGGTVTLEVAPCDTKYTISVSDTGVGMSETQMQHLFRLDSTHSSKGTANESGSGLGLIVCKDMLDKHGSKLYIESEEGKGSKFCFKI